MVLDFQGIAIIEKIQGYFVPVLYTALGFRKFNYYP